ncbi:hypothetical protein BKA81DRAFT_365924 [Phyllosticta paracitricarpa]
MSLPVQILAVVVAVYFLVRYFNRTDMPKIKGIPEIPGVPIFGNLIQLGTNHAKVAREWSKKYGPVFQVRLGNRVSSGEKRMKCVHVGGSEQIASVSSSQTALILSAICGFTTNLRSFRDPRSTLSTRLCLVPRA